MAFMTPPDINKPNETLANSQNVYGGEGSEVIVTAQINRDMQDKDLRYPLDVGETAGLDSYIEFRLVNEETLDIGNVVKSIVDTAVALKNKTVKLGKDVGGAFVAGATEEEIKIGQAAIRTTAVEVGGSFLNTGNELLNTVSAGFQTGANTAMFVDDGEVVYVEPETKGRTVKLYMPPSFSYSDGVNYDNVELGVGGAMSLNALTKDRKTSVLKDALSLGASTIGAMASGNSEMTSLAYQRVAGKLSSVLGVEQLASGTGMAVTKAATRIVTSPNVRVLFNSTNMRNFSMTFNLIASSKKEAEEIKEIVKHFRKNLYPIAKVANFGGKPVELGLKYPDRFLINMMFQGKEVFTKIKPCYLTGVQTVYNAEQTGMHADGNPYKVDVTLNFAESLAINRQDVEYGGY
jgi:hypothetical protein